MSGKIILKGRTEILKPVITEILAMHQILESKDIGTFYADDNSSPPVRRRGKPKITLYFLADTNFRSTGTQSRTPHGKKRKDGVISFRLMNETSATFSKANQKTIARKIRDIFGANGGYRWEKGKDMFAYTDWDMGYQLELLCKTKTEAKRIITSVLSIQNHIPDWKKLTHSEADDAYAKYPVLPGKKIIAGGEIQLIEQRPIVNVRFQYAYASVEGRIEPIGLYDRRGKLRDVVIKDGEQ